MMTGLQTPEAVADVPSLSSRNVGLPVVKDTDQVKVHQAQLEVVSPIWVS
jgi:hypothetical protein